MHRICREGPELAHLRSVPAGNEKGQENEDGNRMENNHTPSHHPQRLDYEPHRKLSSDEPDQGDDSSYPPPAIPFTHPGQP
jgi:hypothetical protein